MNLDASVEKSELDSFMADQATNDPGNAEALSVTDDTATPAVPAPAEPQPLVQQPVEYPRPHDVLLPAEGYQLWPGNAHFLMLIETHQAEFAQGTRSEQAQLAAHILQTVKREGGRFLTAIEVPMTEASALSAQKSIVRTSAWDLMKDADVLVHLGESLGSSRQMDEARRYARKEKKRRRKDRKRRRKERRRERRRQRELLKETATQEAVSPSAMGALQSLYYVPSYYPGDKRKTLECESESLSSSSTSSSEDETEVVVKKKRIAVRKPSLPSRPLVPATTPAPFMVATHPPLTYPTQPAVAPYVPQAQVNFHYKPKPNKSLKAAVYTEGEMTLPKGVTVRPSGKWQAQTYFAGQSRYVGVYDTSRLAARAYVVVQEYLRQYRGSNSITKDSPKEDLAVIFANARRAADDAVRELLQQDGSSVGAAFSYKPLSITMPDSTLQPVAGTEMGARVNAVLSPTDAAAATPVEVKVDTPSEPPSDRPVEPPAASPTTENINAESMEF